MKLALMIVMIFVGVAALASPARQLRPLTGVANLPAGYDFGDPSAPDFSESGVVRIYTTGGERLTWRASKSATAIENMLSGKPARHDRLRLYHEDGKTEFDAQASGEDGWDPSIQVGANGIKFLFAGVMSPGSHRRNALWPEDHWSRRTFKFRWRNRRWVKEPESIFGSIPDSPTWLGHNYGHDILKLADGRRFLYYEKVTEEREGHPWKTEIFARRVNENLDFNGPEISVLTLTRPWRAARRSDGSQLAEGPRAFVAGGKILIAFSGGDYASDRYGMHLLWAERVEGPYHPYLEANDLKDFGSEIEKQIPMAWGAGRPAFFEVQGEWWVVFHGIDQRAGPVPQNGLRNVYLAPVSIVPRNSGPPEIRVKIKD